MRNLLYVLIFLFSLCFQACVEDEKDIFDTPSTERLSETLKKYQQILTEVPNGWIMEYYPKGNCAYGGYLILLSFTEEEVAMSSETNPTPVSSLYSLKGDTGPVLSFDTYNEVFHFFSDPQVPGLEGLGYEGDYEFVIMGQEKDELILEGKKTGNTIRMKPLPADQSWNETLASIQHIIQVTTPPEGCCYSMEVDGNPVLIERKGRALLPETGGRTLELDYVNGSDTLTLNVPFIYTTTGIKFYQPVQIGGKEIQYFDWSEIERNLQCTDNNVDARISTIPMSPNKKYAYSTLNWYLTLKVISSPFLTRWLNANQILKDQQGLSLYKIFLSYDAEYEGQFLEVDLTDGYNIYACLLLMYVKPVKWTEDEIDISFSGLVDDNGNAFYGNGGKEIVEMMSGRYSLTGNPSDNPTSFFFQKTDGSDVWFELSIE